MRLGKAAELVEIAGPETLAYYAFPEEHPAAARLRHIAGTRWSTKRYLNMELLTQRNAMIA